MPVESHQQYLLHRGLDRAKGVHGYLGRLFFREAERPGGDRRKRDRPGSELVGDLDGASVARSEYVDLSVIASTPDRSNRVDDETGRKAERRGGLGVSGLAAAKNRASGGELFCPGCSVNRAVNASTASALFAALTTASTSRVVMSASSARIVSGIAAPPGLPTSGPQAVSAGVLDDRRPYFPYGGGRSAAGRCLA